MNIKDIIEFLNERNVVYSINGAKDQELVGFSSVFKYKPNTLTWLRDVKLLNDVESNLTPFSCLVTKNNVRRLEQAVCQIWVDNPKDIFFDIVEKFWGENENAAISSFAFIEDGAIIGKNVSIGPFTYISSKTIVGDNSSIGCNVTIKGKTTIGRNCVIQSGAVLGEDGFGFIKQENTQKFVKHYGGVTVKDNVLIGAQTCICRGAIDDTYIDEYTKIDNLCHIAHNVEIGKRCLVIAGAIVMGSVHIGDDCWISTSIIRNLKHVGDNSTVGMGAVVVKDVPSDATVIGNPAKPYVSMN